MQLIKNNDAMNDAIIEYLLIQKETDRALKKAIENDSSKNMEECISYINKRAKEHLKSKNGYIARELIFGWVIHYLTETKETLEKESGKIEKVSTVTTDTKKVVKKKVEKQASGFEQLSLF